MGWKEVGRVTRYFGRISVAGVRLSDRLQVGEHVYILGATSDFEQDVTSMELNHEAVEIAEKGQEIGLRVVKRARRGDIVFRVEEE